MKNNSYIESVNITPIQCLHLHIHLFDSFSVLFNVNLNSVNKNHEYWQIKFFYTQYNSKKKDIDYIQTIFTAKYNQTSKQRK